MIAVHRPHETSRGHGRCSRPDERHRPVVLQRYDHHLAEPSGLQRYAGRRQLCGEQLEQSRNRHALLVRCHRREEWLRSPIRSTRSSQPWRLKRCSFTDGPSVTQGNRMVAARVLMSTKCDASSKERSTAATSLGHPRALHSRNCLMVSPAPARTKSRLLDRDSRRPLVCRVAVGAEDRWDCSIDRGTSKRPVIVTVSFHRETPEARAEVTLPFHHGGRP